MAAWIRAVRPAGLVNIVLLSFLGQAISISLGLGYSPRVFWLLLLYCIIIHLATAFSIEQADSDVGRRRRSVSLFAPITDGGRTFRGRVLPVDAVRIAIPVLGGLALLVAGLLWFLGGTWHILVMTVVLGVLVWLAEHPPLRLSFTGGGEALYVIGGAVALPVIGYAAQTGTIGAFPWRILLVAMPATLALIIALDLPGREDDRDVDRRSVVALVGSLAGQGLVLLFLGVAVALLGVRSAFGWSLEVRLLSIALPSLLLVFTFFSFFAEQRFSLHIRFVRLSVAAFESIVLTVVILLLIA